MAKRALIVDDSKTARQVLSNKLQQYDILVDTRESAAAAIDYLYEESPDAIFMDYEMPGMDGFQALKVIKSNPDTAVIPVMMYTSKAGGLALSQARALGAVGVLPKQLEPQNLEEVLRTLHLMPEQESLVHGVRDADLRDTVRKHHLDNVHPIHGGDPFHELPVEMVSLPQEDLESDLASAVGVKRSLRREMSLTEERLQERLDKHFSELHAELFELEAHQEESEQLLGRLQFGGWILGLMTAAVLIALFYLFSSGLAPDASAPGRESMTGAVLNQLAEQDEKLDLLTAQLDQLAAGGVADTNAGGLPLGLMEWAANRGTGFEYGDLPFDDERAVWLSELVEQLKQAGFKGTVELRASYGNFCLSKDADGAWQVAAPELDIAQCQFAEQVKGSGGWRNDQSVSFANYLNLELARSGGQVEILLFSNGFNDPLVPYPVEYEVKTAGEWNQIARLNQRLKVSLYSN